MTHCRTKDWGKLPRITSAPRVTLFTTKPTRPWLAVGVELRARLAAQTKVYPTVVLPPSTITKSARKGKRWALEIVKTWIAKKQADEILGHREIEA